MIPTVTKPSRSDLLESKIQSSVRCGFARSAINCVLREMDAGASEQESIDYEVNLLMYNGAKSSARQVVKFFEENL